MSRDKRSPVIQFRIGQEGFSRLVELGILDEVEGWDGKKVNLKAKDVFLEFLDSNKAQRAVDSDLDFVKNEVSTLRQDNAKLSQNIAELKQMVASLVSAAS